MDIAHIGGRVHQAVTVVLLLELDTYGSIEGDGSVWLLAEEDYRRHLGHSSSVAARRAAVKGWCRMTIQAATLQLFRQESEH